jgi:MoxR-like ATPase
MAKSPHSGKNVMAADAASSTPQTATAPLNDPFRNLGLYGLGPIAPVLLAALIAEEPLLLIGAHGTAKSLLLTRIAGALGLEFRHYNASLLNFDDLVGFPMPGKDGQLDYVKTPSAIWGAQAVIFDEISRCRPDVQNKLFPIIHERKVQGLALDGLRYRWSAMNPPSTDDSDNGYLGSEPLDAALADRFAYVLVMPAWSSLNESDQLAVIQAQDQPISAEAGRSLMELIERARASLPLVEQALSAGVAAYVRTLCALLSQANVVLSPRRAGMLYRNVISVNTATALLDPSMPTQDSVLLAVRNALPQRAQGIAVSEVKLLAAHREAWRMSQIAEGDPLKAILCTVDPIARLRLAVAASECLKGEFSQVVADVLAQLPGGGREAAVVHLFETGAIGRLNAAVAGQAAELYRDLATAPVFSETMHANHARFRTWGKVKDLLSRLDPLEPRSYLRANALAAAYSRKEITSPEDAQRAFDAFVAIDTQLVPA